MPIALHLLLLVALQVAQVGGELPMTLEVEPRREGLDGLGAVD